MSLGFKICCAIYGHYGKKVASKKDVIIYGDRNDQVEEMERNIALVLHRG